MRKKEGEILRLRGGGIPRSGTREKARRHFAQNDCWEEIANIEVGCILSAK
jgi:hypothetical protein